MKKGIININDIKLVIKGQKSSFAFHKPVLKTKDGDDVYSGDTVEFDTDGSIFKSSGTISNDNGLKIHCFNTLINKWEHYEIKENIKIV